MFYSDETAENYTAETTPSGSGLVTAKNFSLPDEIEEPEEKSIQQIDQEHLERSIKDRAKAKLYSAEDENLSGEKELSKKGAREFGTNFVADHMGLVTRELKEEIKSIRLSAKEQKSARHADRSLLTFIDRLENNLGDQMYNVMALVGLTNTLKGLQTGDAPAPPEHKITRNIGTEIEFECFVKYIKSIDPALMEYIDKNSLIDVNTRRGKNIKQQFIQIVDDFYEVDWQWEKNNNVMRLGQLIRECVFNATDCFELLPALGGNGHKQYAIVLTEKGARIKSQIMRAAEFTIHTNFPLIAPPRAWDNDCINGGYYTSQPYPLNVMVRNSMGSTISNAARKALNALQSQPFAINEWIFNIQSELISKNVEIGSFRAHNAELYEQVDNPLIQDPDHLEYSWNDEELTEEEIRKRNLAYRVKKLWEEEKDLTAQKAVNPKRVLIDAEDLLFMWFGKAEDAPKHPGPNATEKQIEAYEKYRKNYIVVEEVDAKPRHYTEFYSMWYMDNRSRCYPSTDTLNVQGSDYQKALIRFAHGIPKSVQSKAELLVSIATTYGNKIDKLSFHQRLVWARGIRDVMDMIAEDPLSTNSMDFWTKADEPFQFLALCHEYVNVFRKRIQDKHYVSAGRDATCSGIQITGAMLRDERTCNLVNVTPSPEPQDAYNSVAGEARGLLTNPEWLLAAVEKNEKNRRKRSEKWHKEFKSMVEEGLRSADKAPPEYQRRSYEDTVAQMDEWIDLIDRSVAKMPTMLIPYGGSFLTIYSHVREKLEKKTKKIPSPDFVIITHALIEGMGLALPAFSAVNAWFQSLADATIKLPRGDDEKVTILWETPNGSQIKQAYRIPDMSKVVTYAGSATNVRSYTSMEDNWDGTDATEVGQNDPTKGMNTSKMKTALAANVVHSVDAAIIQDTVNTIIEMEDYTIEGVPFTAVHDCIYGPSGAIQTLQRAVRVAFSMAVRDNITESIAENNLPDEEFRKLLPILEMGTADVSLDNIQHSKYLFS